VPGAAASRERCRPVREAHAVRDRLSPRCAGSQPGGRGRAEALPCRRSGAGLFSPAHTMRVSRPAGT
jgi:hypothetical protein